MRLIGLHGKAGAGKDTFADRLVARHGFVKRGFADPLYEEVAAAYGTTPARLRNREMKERDQGALALRYCENDVFVQLMLALGFKDLEASRSPRWLLQHWGTDYRRAERDTYWLDHMACFVSEVKGAEGIVIPDTRFFNEAQWILQRRGQVVQIVRPGIAAVSPHASENELPADMIGLVVRNDGDIFRLHAVADNAFGVDCRTT